MSAMMGMNPKGVELLQIANNRGLGEIDLKKINVIGKVEQIPNFKLALSSAPMKKTFPVYNTMAHLILSRTGLEIDKEKCKRCHVCFENCPVKAIDVLDDGTLLINRKKCIKCYCCKELCPHDAIRVKGFASVMKKIVIKMRKI